MSRCASQPAASRAGPPRDGQPLPPRRLVRLVGDRAETAAAARAALRDLPPDDVLWVGADPQPDLPSTTKRGARERLGRGYAAVALDLHGGPHPDALALCQGFVRAGGALLLRLDRAAAPDPALMVEGSAINEVGVRLDLRLRRLLPDDPAGPLAPCAAGRGTAEQAAAVARIVAMCAAPSVIAVLAPRGRGKSTALGLALRHLAESGLQRATVCAGTPGGADALMAAAPPGVARLVSAAALADDDGADILLVDEAAAIPIAALRRAVLARPTTPILLATTTDGYEGTGRGFALRLLPWLSELDRPTATISLETPMRFAADDPVEVAVHAALALAPRPPPPLPPGPPIHHRLDRAALAEDDALLEQVFGLLVSSHYRTTPGDLHRLLDAPNLEVHASMVGGVVAAVNLIAREGRLSPDLCADVAAGRARPRGHALPDTLLSHAGLVEAGALAMARSVRIAVRPDARRAGLGAALTEAALAATPHEVAGTVFSATPETIAFRRALGFAVVRVGASRGARTGEPAVVMLRARSARAEALIADLRCTLAQDLPLQLALLRADDPLLDDRALADALGADLPPPRPRTDAEVASTLARYAHGPLHFEGAAGALLDLVARHPDAPLTGPPDAATALRARLLERRSWVVAARAGGFPTVPAAQRAIRRAAASWLGGAHGRRDAAR